MACGSADERIRLHLERANAQRTRGAHAAAILEYRSALEEDPNLAEAHYGLAQALAALGNTAEASWELRETIRLDPQNLEARLRFGWLALAADKHREALEQAEAMLALDAEHLEGRFLKTAALLAAGDLDRAAAESLAILEQRPDEKRALHDLATVRTRQGRIADAESHLLRYQALDRGSLVATRELLRFYEATDQDAKAESFLRDALAESAAEERAELALALAELLARLDRASEAEAPLREALAASPERLDVRARLAQILAADERFEAGRALLEEARRQSGMTPELSRALGDLLADAGLLEDALRTFQEGIALAPDSIPLRLREAEVLMQMGSLEQSGERMRTLLEEYPEDRDVALAHIHSLRRAGRSDEAIERLRELLARHPEDPGAHFLLGALWLDKKRPNEALGSLEVAANGLRGEESRAARRLLAQAHLEIGDLMASVRIAERLLTEDPEDLPARLLLADALLEGGLAGRAEAVLEGARGSESPALLAARARLFARTGRLPQAQAAIEQAVALEPDSLQWVEELAWVLFERGEADAAVRLVESRMVAQPAAPEYPNLVGRIRLRQQDLAAAERAFRQAVDVDPGFLEGYLNLARMARRAQRFEEALDLYQRALAQRPEDAGVLRELGSLEYSGGRTEAAIEAYEASLRADPNSAATSAGLARALSETGRDLARALELARLARTQDPTNIEFAETLGNVLERSGLYAAAAAQYRECIALDPRPNAQYHYRLGVALHESGEPEGAAHELQEALEIDAEFPGADDAGRRLAALALPER